MNDRYSVLIGLVLLIAMTVAPMAFGQDTGTSSSEPGLELLHTSKLTKDCKDLKSSRMGLDSPKEALFWPDYRGEPSAGLWCNLSIVLAGFSFLAIIALLQSCVGRTAADGTCILNDRDLSITISILISSLLLFLIAADLFSWADGDKIEIRNSLTFMIANFVVAEGILTILFGLIWAFHLFQVRPFANCRISN